MLDRAEALRAKRRAALAQLDSLIQSLFLDLFGDPATNPKWRQTIDAQPKGWRWQFGPRLRACYWAHAQTVINRSIGMGIFAWISLTDIRDLDEVRSNADESKRD